MESQVAATYIKCRVAVAYFSKPFWTLPPILHETKYTGFIERVEDFEIGTIGLSDDSLVTRSKGS
jgi:hypothetical protein